VVDVPVARHRLPGAAGLSITARTSGRTPGLTAAASVQGQQGVCRPRRLLQTRPAAVIDAGPILSDNNRNAFTGGWLNTENYGVDTSAWSIKFKDRDDGKPMVLHLQGKRRSSAASTSGWRSGAKENHEENNARASSVARRRPSNLRAIGAQTAFTKYVALGDSITAGVQGGCLVSM
jgi:hypothetical protein